ncbi:toxic anion resistance protein [Vibrio hyugaensis]|uniref:toxic anion resistance protein n=1 Tax=Vibrio hyugaensis TaxID=1534743 RepID=UPI0005F0A2E2|nr:toxic anion resistance protein [Vibrio hyugaensis]
MVKTFHNKKSNQNSSVVLPRNEESRKSTVKQFDSIKPTKTLLSESEYARGQEKKIEKTTELIPKKVPSVLFSSKVSAIQSDLISVEESTRNKIDKVCSHEFNDIELSNSEYLLIRNIYDSIKFNDPAFQIEFGNEESKKFQELQGFLSDYAKLGKVDRILDLGKTIIRIAKSINIDIFNPNKIGTRLSKIFGTRSEKVRKIKYEFDSASDSIDVRINRVFDNLSEMQSTLEQFQLWERELRSLNRILQLKTIALIIKLEEESTFNDSLSGETSGIFKSNDEEFAKRWERKVQTLFSLNNSIILTYPQIDLYKSNLLLGFERFEKIKVDIIQVWKQQFLTVIAVDESNDSIFYFELNDIQEQLIRNIEELG